MGDVKGGILMGRNTGKEFRSAGLVQAAIDAFSDGRVTIHPERSLKTCLDWLAKNRDWPISRQLWWGHRIPVWAKDCQHSAARNEPIFKALADLFRKEPALANTVIVKISLV